MIAFHYISCLTTWASCCGIARGSTHYRRILCIVINAFLGLVDCGIMTCRKEPFVRVVSVRFNQPRQMQRQCIEISKSTVNAIDASECFRWNFWPRESIMGSAWLKCLSNQMISRNALISRSVSSINREVWITDFEPQSISMTVQWPLSLNKP